MPVMRHLNIGGTTYDTVGEASVTQVQSSGTKIATVSIDGTSTDIYAPSGGSSVEPATAAPIVDGTAAVGSSAKYAREDHVHPTDTSRLSGVTLDTSADTYVVPVTNGTARIDIGDGLKVSDSNNKATISAKTGTTSGTVATGDHTHSGYAAAVHEHSGADITSGTVGFAYLPTGTGASQVAVGNHTHSGYASSTHFHGSITSVGAITSDTAAESGDKLVIVDANDANKLKRSGIAFGTDTTTFLRNDGQWATPSGGGGGGSWTDVSSDFYNMTGWGSLNNFVVLSDGKSVIISGTISAEEESAEIPSDYEAFKWLIIGQCTNVNGNVTTPPYVEGFGDGNSSLSTGVGTEGEYFTVTYPLASAVS